MNKYLVAKVWNDGSLGLIEPKVPMSMSEAKVFLDVNRRADEDHKFVLLEVTEE